MNVLAVSGFLYLLLVVLAILGIIWFLKSLL